MQYRRLGDGLELSAIGLGCMGMTIAYGERNDDESIAAVHYAVERGINHIDTADAYGSGKNETLLSRALGELKGKVMVATKFGQIRNPDGSGTVSGHPDYVAEACDASLQRMGIDVIDLYYQHRVDPDVPIEETVGAMSRLIEAGKVRHLGLSEAGADTIRRAHATHPIAALQTEYSLWSRDVEEELLPLCRELGIGFVPYAPLGRGFLSAGFKKVEDFMEGDRRLDHPRFKADTIAENISLLTVLEEIAEARNCKPAQVAIAWVLARGEDIVPIPGTKHNNYIDENIAAVDLELDANDMNRLGDVFKPGVTSGDRYPAGAMKRLGL